MRIIGRFDNPAQAPNFLRRNDEYAIVMSPLTYEQFKDQLRAYPNGIPGRFTDKPVKFCKIQDGEAKDPTHNALRYFFIWNPDGSFVWKQTSRKQSGVLKV